MVEWFEALTGVERIFAVFAIPSTVLVLIQTVMLLVGLGGSGAADIPSDTSALGDGVDTVVDADLDADVDDINEIDSPADSGLRLFTVRGVVAFFAVFGWCGLAVSRAGGSIPVASLSALGTGIIVLIGLALMMRWIVQLQESGNIDERGAVGHSGSVYLQIPPARTGIGKVMLLIQEQFVEFNAVTDDAEGIPTGREVVVVDISGRSTMVVRMK